MLFGKMYFFSAQETVFVKLWFDEWNTRGADLTWDVKQFFHKNNQTIVEWYFKNKMNDGSVEAFDGMSLIQWTVIIGFVF